MAYNTSIQGQYPMFMISRRARIPVDMLCRTGQADVSGYVAQHCKILQETKILNTVNREIFMWKLFMW